MRGSEFRTTKEQERVLRFAFRIALRRDGPKLR
jgi:hypothetical protein